MQNPFNNSYEKIETEIGGKEFSTHEDHYEEKNSSPTIQVLIGNIRRTLNGEIANISIVEKLLDYDEKEFSDFISDSEFEDINKYLNEILKGFDFSNASAFTTSKRKFFEKNEGNFKIGCALWLKGLMLEREGNKNVSSLCIQASDKVTNYPPAILKTNIKCSPSNFPIERLALAAKRGSNKALGILQERVKTSSVDLDIVMGGIAQLSYVLPKSEESEIENKLKELKDIIVEKANKALKSKTVENANTEKLSKDEITILFYTSAYFLKDQRTSRGGGIGAPPVVIPRTVPVEIEQFVNLYTAEYQENMATKQKEYTKRIQELNIKYEDHSTAEYEEKKKEIRLDVLTSGEKAQLMILETIIREDNLLPSNIKKDCLEIFPQISLTDKVENPKVDQSVKSSCLMM